MIRFGAISPAENIAARRTRVTTGTLSKAGTPQVVPARAVRSPRHRLHHCHRHRHHRRPRHHHLLCLHCHLVRRHHHRRHCHQLHLHHCAHPIPTYHSPTHLHPRRQHHLCPHPSSRLQCHHHRLSLRTRDLRVPHPLHCRHIRHQRHLLRCRRCRRRRALRAPRGTTAQRAPPPRFHATRAAIPTRLISPPNPIAPCVPRAHFASPALRLQPTAAPAALLAVRGTRCAPSAQSTATRALMVQPVACRVQVVTHARAEAVFHCLPHASPARLRWGRLRPLPTAASAHLATSVLVVWHLLISAVLAASHQTLTRASVLRARGRIRTNMVQPHARDALLAIFALPGLRFPWHARRARHPMRQEAPYRRSVRVSLLGSTLPPEACCLSLVVGRPSSAQVAVLNRCPSVRPMPSMPRHIRTSHSTRC